MQMLIHSILSSSRKRRCRAVSFALWLLRIIHGIEEDEMNRYSDALDGFGPVSDNVSRHRYNAVEDDYLECECAVGYLISAIEDLEFAFEVRF